MDRNSIMIREKYGKNTGTKYFLFVFQTLISIDNYHKNISQKLAVLSIISAPYRLIFPAFSLYKIGCFGLYESMTYIEIREQIPGVKS